MAGRTMTGSWASTWSLPNGVITTYNHEPKTGRLTSINASLGNDTFYYITYEYNYNSQRDWAQVVQKTTGGLDEWEEWEFHYDN